MAKKSAAYPHLKALEVYKKICADVCDVKGATMPYTSLNGHMSSFLDADGRLALRLEKTDRARFLDDFENALCTAHGRVMKEYVLVPEDVFFDESLIRPYFEQSWAYAKTLKPKN